MKRVILAIFLAGEENGDKVNGLKSINTTRTDLRGACQGHYVKVKVKF
jgi:hypothetical protein